MRDARVTASVATTVLGLFNIFRRKEDASTPPTVRVTPASGPELPPQPPEAPPAPPSLRDSVRFKALHADVNPSASVRPAQMTCVSCSHSFRYFVNSNGQKTVCTCPGCGRQYRV